VTGVNPSFNEDLQDTDMSSRFRAVGMSLKTKEGKRHVVGETDSSLLCPLQSTVQAKAEAVPPYKGLRKTETHY
jgi:hypothetical protein